MLHPLSLHRSLAVGRLPVLLLIAALLAPAAAAEEILFDELPAANDNCCFLSDEYADLGILFETTDDGSIWDGIDNKDPGRWGLNGSAGQAFLGFNGSSYEATVHFDEPVVDFAFDFARSAATTGSGELRVWASLAGEAVEFLRVPLAGVNQWTTVQLTSEVDQVRWKLAGSSGFRPYGVDHLRWEWAAPPEPEIALVEIDALPFRRRGVMTLTSRAVVPVLLYGSEDFAVEDVDPATLAFGPAGASALGRWFGPHQFDRNRDGLFDLLLFVRAQDAGLEPGMNEPCLTGATYEGMEFEGCDTLEMKEPRRWGHRHHHRHGGRHHGHGHDD
jgi:hypothetical protein